MDKQTHRTKESLPSSLPQHQGLAGWRENLEAQARTQKYAGRLVQASGEPGEGAVPGCPATAKVAVLDTQEASRECCGLARRTERRGGTWAVVGA